MYKKKVYKTTAFYGDADFEETVFIIGFNDVESRHTALISIDSVRYAMDNFYDYILGKKELNDYDDDDDDYENPINDNLKALNEIRKFILVGNDNLKVRYEYDAESLMMVAIEVQIMDFDEFIENLQNLKVDKNNQPNISEVFEIRKYLKRKVK